MTFPRIEIRSGKSAFSFIRGMRNDSQKNHAVQRRMRVANEHRSPLAGPSSSRVRFGEACSHPYSYSYFKTRTPRPIVLLNTLCRMRRLAYNVAALRPPSELVMACWQRPFARRRARASRAAPLRCLSREVQFAPDIKSGNGLLVNAWG